LHYSWQQSERFAQITHDGWPKFEQVILLQLLTNFSTIMPWLGPILKEKKTYLRLPDTKSKQANKKQGNNGIPHVMGSHIN
jgi:hypothetical protein